MDEKTILEKLDAVLKLNENLMDEIKKKDKEIKSLKSDGKKFNVLVGSNSVMGVSLVSPSGDIEADIPFNDTVMLSSSDVESLLKSSTVRSQFMKGLLYFEEESNYEVFSVKRKYNLRRENIKNILNTNSVEKIHAFFDNVKADGTDVKTMDELNAIKNSHNIGDEMKITVNRDGQEIDLTITLGEQP